MRSQEGIWVLGGVSSVLLHLGAAEGLMAALKPQPFMDQPTPESRLTVEAENVTRSDAAEHVTQSDAAPLSDTNPTALEAGEIAQSKAAAASVPIQKTHAQDAPATMATASSLQISPLAAQSMPISAVTPAQTPTLTAAVATNLMPGTSKPLRPDPGKATRLAPQVTPAKPEKPQFNSALSAQPPRTIIGEQSPDVPVTKAMLAFPSAGYVDPVSLAAFQSFTQPRAGDSADVRDSLTAALSVPCARMQVTFDPDTVTLKLFGHLPRDDDRGPVLSALRDQVGADIQVADNLLVLPAPQCGALSGIAAVGLPQSTDQITNQLIVGADTHARAFRYAAGEPLVLELTAPDYPAFIYVDYFDADGNVIHLSPNDRAPLQRVDAKSALQIGARTAEDVGLFVKIGPPYGQEIAAAFAASVPLYDAHRPLIEPAAPYLEWLKDQVTTARAQNADFKGEWVYFFVTTAAE